MQTGDELFKAVVVGCYNGMITDVRLEDDSVRPVFCSARDVVRMCKPGTGILIRRIFPVGRRIPYELEFLELAEGLVYARPSRNNDLFEEAFLAGNLPEFSAYDECRRLEPDDHLPHVDFELSNAAGEKCFVFVTNIYHKFGGCAVFPMKVNFFELEMFEEMRRLRREGHRTCVFMIVPRMDCREIRFSWKYSPLAAAKIFDEAKNGLNFIGYGCNIDKKSVTLSHLMPILY